MAPATSFFRLLPTIIIRGLSASVKRIFSMAVSNMTAAGFCLPTVSEMIH